jgi:hypothetical protein
VLYSRSVRELGRAGPDLVVVLTDGLTPRPPAPPPGIRVAGVGASAVARWRDAGTGFAEPAASQEFGCSLDEARQQKAEGKTPSETYLRRIRKLRPARP